MPRLTAMPLTLIVEVIKLVGVEAYIPAPMVILIKATHSYISAGDSHLVSENVTRFVVLAAALVRLYCETHHPPSIHYPHVHILLVRHSRVANRRLFPVSLDPQARAL